MAASPSTPSRSESTAQTALTCAVIAAAFWVVRYWHIASFGWYEDDLTIIPRAIQLSAPELFAYVWSYIVHLYGHARPLSDSFIYIFSHYGWLLDGIAGAYWIGYAIQVVNLVLFYFLLKHIHSHRFALVGCLAYLLYSADTTQVFLTHSLGLHPSITLLLLAYHAYLSNKKPLAYLLAFIILFSYETPFLVFAGAPLAARNWEKGWLKRFLIHAGILAAMVIGVYILRVFVGEGRVEGMSLIQIITTPILHVLEGPLVSLGTYFYRPIQALRRLDPEIGLAMVAGFALFTWLLWRSNQGGAGLTTQAARASLAALMPHYWIKAIRSGTLPEEISAEWRELIRLAGAGLVMLLAAYPLTFTVRAYAITGRDTRVHAAAVFGAAFLWACLGTLLIGAAEAYRKKYLAVLPLALLFAMLAGYGFVIQGEYTLGWQAQKDFWTELVPLIEDAGPDTIILVEPGGLTESRQIGANTWNLPRILNQLYEFPSDWKNPPRVYRLSENWQNQILTVDGQFQINASTSVAPPSLYTTVDPVQVIFISTSGGELVRREKPLPLGDTEYALKPGGEPVLTDMPNGFLYRIMLGD